MSLPLTEEQKKWWSRLFELTKNSEIAHLESLQLAIRKLGLEIIAQQPETDHIAIAGQVLIRFPTADFKTKQDYIQYHSKDGAWAEDPILYSVLHKLGYQPIVKLVDTDLASYLPFTQSNTGLKIELENHNAVNGGTHWQLKQLNNPGQGNCGYYAIAQQVQKDYQAVAKTLNIQEQPSSKIEITPKNNRLARITEVATAIEKVTAEFAQMEVVDQQRYEKAKTLLQKCDTKALIQMYHYAVNHLVGEDTYLKRRPSYVTQEQGSDFFEQALKTGMICSEHQAFEFIIREELIHALAKEAWRNPKAYTALTEYCAKFNFSQNRNGFNALRCQNEACDKEREISAMPELKAF